MWEDDDTVELGLGLLIAVITLQFLFRILLGV